MLITPVAEGMKFMKGQFASKNGQETCEKLVIGILPMTVKLTYNLSLHLAQGQTIF